MSIASAAAGTRRAAQMSFDELGRPLREVTFCVVDLETTGGSAAGGAMITEIGAVKVRGGEILGEFQTLVDPHASIPPFIAGLTGITDAMVDTAPPIESALPTFLEFAQGCVLVAHNAPFDVGFLRHFAALQDRPWPGFEVLDTATLARRVVTRDDAPDCKLSSLALLFGSSTTPNHRALTDARATVDVLHGLMERLGNLGVATVEELSTFSAKVAPELRRKRHLAESLPHALGVYLFADEDGEILYVGVSHDLRSRVRAFFTSSETHSRIGEMMRIAAEVEAIECATPLEAEVQELRLLARHRPRYNRRSRFPQQAHWVRLPVGGDRPPSVVRTVPDDGAEYLGPLSSGKAARVCLDTLHAYAATSTAVGYDVVDALAHQWDRCETEPPDEDEEEGQRDRVADVLRVAARSQRLTALTRCPEVVAARREADGRWTVHVIRHGRLCGAGVISRQTHAGEFVTRLRADAEQVLPGPLPPAGIEEAESVLRWLEQPGVRLVHLEGEWSCPIRGAARHRAVPDPVQASREALIPFEESSPPPALRRPVVRALPWAP